ncbi:cAMP-independent regulatory protein pac2 [Ceratobasidium sp. AG-Ba]|nr:cAMP-independent regulatory protein pac2 [Ceratobasidium sp. AG-Ba]
MNESPLFLLKSTKDALLVIEAAERGLFPRLVRRLTEKERANYIRSGAVFVYDEFESGIKRFTDTMIWSPSRIVGNYLVYRQMRKHEPRPSSRAAASLPTQPASMRSLARPRPESVLNESERARKRREQLYVGSLTSNDKFKPDGLVKRTFSLMGEGKHIHVIAYYTYEDAMNERFETPSEHSAFDGLTISSDLFKDLSAYRVPPRVETLANGKLAYAGEDFDKLEISPSDIDRDSPVGTASTGASESDIPSIPPIDTPSSEPSFELPPLFPLRPVRMARQGNLGWDNTLAPSPSNYDGPAYSTNARLEPNSYPVPNASNASLAPLSLPPLAPVLPRQAPRLRDARNQQQPYQLRPISRTLREANTPLGEEPPPPYPWLLPVAPRLDENVLTPVPVRLPRAYEVGPSGERVEYDIPEGRWTPNSGMISLYSGAGELSGGAEMSGGGRYGRQQ